MSADTCGSIQQFLAGHKLHVHVAEIEFEFEQAGKFEQPCPELFDSCFHSSPQLPHRGLVCGFGGGCNQVADGFGLGYVDSSGLYSPPGEFAWMRKAAAAATENVDSLFLYPGTSVECYFHSILGGERSRRTIHRSHTLVDIVTVAVGKSSQMCGV